MCYELLLYIKILLLLAAAWSPVVVGLFFSPTIIIIMKIWGDDCRRSDLSWRHRYGQLGHVVVTPVPPQLLSAAACRPLIFTRRSSAFYHKLLLQNSVLGFLSCGAAIIESKVRMVVLLFDLYVEPTWEVVGCPSYHKTKWGCAPHPRIYSRSWELISP